MQKLSPFFLLSLVCLFIVSCTSTPPSEPLNQELRLKKLVDKDPFNQGFKDYLQSHGYASLNAWDLNTLTLCALFFHPQLDIAKEKLALAQLDVEIAGRKQTPTLNADFARSNQKNGDIRPWSYGLSLDIPINTNSKREIRIESARIDADIVRFDMAETAWQLRNQIAMDLVAYYRNEATKQLLQEIVDIQSNISSMLEKRVLAGIASRTELSHANLLRLQAIQDLNQHRAESQLIETKLAAHVGLTPEKFAQVKIKPLDIEAALVKQREQLNASFSFQEAALLNRIDIRRGIATYAQAESALKLEAAKQIPDITLSPGFLFEFGDRIWSLGFSSLLNMFQNNDVLIERAKQLRAVEGATFESLQANVIAEVNQTYATYLSAQEAVNQTKKTRNAQDLQEQKMQKQLDIGLIGKLDFYHYKINTLTAKKQYADAQFQLLEAAHQIEDVMQKPLENDFNQPLSTMTEPN